VKQAISPVVAIVLVLIAVIVIGAVGYFAFVKPKSGGGEDGGGVDYSKQGGSFENPKGSSDAAGGGPTRPPSQ